MKLVVSKVVDHMTRGICISTDSTKSGDDYFNRVYNTGNRTYTDSDKTNLVYMVG